MSIKGLPDNTHEFTAETERFRVSFARGCLNKAEYLLGLVEGDLAYAQGDEEQELSWVVAEARVRAATARDYLNRYLDDQDE